MQWTAILAMGTVLVLSAPGQVKVWTGKLTLPVYEEGLPNVNPPFDVFETSRFSYPYTMRTSLTGRRVTQDLRAVYLENEYLKCSVLPDIGGHVYSCTDKINGREMFYANPSLKKQLIGYRGAWAAFGIEFNFPVSHNWMSMSPVDFASRANPDGSASVFVGNIDRPYGMEWRVELILRPGSTVLEERVTLYNRSDVRRRYYWWNNAAAEVGDDSRLCYPMRYSASHGFTFVDTWPVNHEGRDISLIKNHTSGPVSQFVHGSREPFMGVWHPRWNSGVVHYASYADLPGKKVWSFGVDADGLDWRRALSDNNSGYVEIQAGLFRNQETYAFLPPQASIRFSEYWMPVRELGGISLANLHGVVYLKRDGARLRAALNVNHAIPNARIRVLDGAKVLFEKREALDPQRPFVTEIPNAPAAAKCTFELSDAGDRPLLVHTEDTYEWAPESEIHAGKQPDPPKSADPLETGADQELNGALLPALDTYRTALRRAPADFALNRAAGRLAVTLKNYAAAVEYLERSRERVSNDPETQYYLGHAYLGLDDAAHARAEWEGAQRQPQFRAAARLQLIQLDSSQGRTQEALDLLRAVLAEQPDIPRARAAQVALLRASGQVAEAREHLTASLRDYPADSFVRNEAQMLGTPDDSLWSHLASDPQRVLEVAVQYMQLGLYQEAVSLLARQYPAHDPQEAEPGTPLPQDDQLVAYYRAFCREKLGQDAANDYRAAARLSTRYVFPYRPTTLTVLKQALKHDSADATAHFLLGDLYFSGGMTDPAIPEWQRARTLNPRLPVLHRNLGKALFTLKHDDQAAAAAFREGLAADPDNIELYAGLSQLLSILDRPAAERVTVLETYPNRAAMPSPLALDLALSYAEAGKFTEAGAMFHNRHFEKEEGGANVREIYLEVKFLEALASPGTAPRDFTQPVPDLDFTSDGLQPFLHEPRFEYYQGLLESKRGNKAGAREHWTKAAGDNGAFGILAAKRLDLPDWKERASSRAGQPDAWIEREVDRGYALLALGRTEEARKVLHECLRQPNYRLSRYLARRALAGAL